MNSQPNDSDQDPDTFMEDCLSDLMGGGTNPGSQLPNEIVESTITQVSTEPVERVSTSTSDTFVTSPASSLWQPEGERIAARNLPESVPRRLGRRQENADMHPMHLATSTFLSLAMVLALLLVARLIVPSLVENIRYGWHRGQLRAEYELSGERLRSVSLDSLADVSQLVSKRAGPSVVHINLLSDRKTIDKIESLIGGKPHPSFKYQGQGSGFVIDRSGYILTNHHVIDEVGAIEVTLSDGRKLPAQLVGADPLTDLAVLKVEANDLMAVEWGDSQDVVVGTPVWAVGSPFGLQQTVTFGIISGKHRVDFSGTLEARSVEAGTPYSDLMQSDVALNPGNSGGPLMNSLGKVIGVNAAILGETFRGVSFSIPSRIAQNVAEQLIAVGEVPRGWLGVKLEDPPDEDRFGEGGIPLAGVRVVGFPPGLTSPARKAGIRFDDKILSFDGLPVTGTADLIRMIGESPVGTTVTLGVQRKEKRLSFQIKLDQRAAQL